MLLSIVNWLLDKNKPMDMVRYKMLHPKRKLDKWEQGQLKHATRIRLMRLRDNDLRDPNDAYAVMQDAQLGARPKMWGPKPGPVLSRKELMRRAKYRAT